MERFAGGSFIVLLPSLRQAKKPAFRQYGDVVGLFKNSMNSHAYQSLTKAEGCEHCEFSQIFGPDKIPAGLGEFLGYFLIRKVMAGENLKRAAGTVTKRLSQVFMERQSAVSDLETFSAAFPVTF